MKVTALVFQGDDKLWHGRIEIRNKVAAKGKNAEVATIRVVEGASTYTIAERAIQLRAEEVGLKITKWVK